MVDLVLVDHLIISCFTQSECFNYLQMMFYLFDVFNYLVVDTKTFFLGFQFCLKLADVHIVRIVNHLVDKR